MNKAVRKCEMFTSKFFTLDKEKRCMKFRQDGKKWTPAFRIFQAKTRRGFGYTPSYKSRNRRGRVSPLHRRLDTVPQPVLAYFGMLVGQVEALLQTLANLF